MKKRKQQGRAPLPLPAGTTVRTGKAEEEGVILLLFRIEIPAFDAAPGRSGAASFYEKLADRIERFLSGALSDSLRAAFLAADPARRRFTFRPAIYVHAVTARAEAGVLSVERTVTLKRAGRLLFSRVFTERWALPDGSFLPSPDAPDPKKRFFGEKGRKKSGKKVDGGAGDML